MEAVAHDPAFAQRVGVPQSVGRDFVRADQRSPRYKHAVGHVLKHASSK